MVNYSILIRKIFIFNEFYPVVLLETGLLFFEQVLDLEIYWTNEVGIYTGTFYTI